MEASWQGAHHRLSPENVLKRGIDLNEYHHRTYN
jgi:hypothetical protein